MARRKRERGRAKGAAEPSDARMRYNLEREPLHSDRGPPQFQIPTQRTGWDWLRRRRMAAWLGVTLIIVIVVFGYICLPHLHRLWEMLIDRWA